MKHYIITLIAAIFCGMAATPSNASENSKRIAELCKLAENKDAEPCVKRRVAQEKRAAKKEQREKRELDLLKK